MITLQFTLHITVTLGVDRPSVWRNMESIEAAISTEKCAGKIGKEPCREGCTDHIKTEFHFIRHDNTSCCER